MDEARKKLLSARISDLILEAERGYVTCTTFLDMAEVFFLKEYVKRTSIRGRVLLFGGYEDAERKCAFFLPEYYEALLPDTSDIKNAFDMLRDDISSEIKALKLTGSGYRTLTHRDYLGALLHLGIDRSALGDICVLDNSSAMIFATPAVAELILGGCEKIGSDKVKIDSLPLSLNFRFERKTKDMSDTVASDRLDCVVASLANLSREKAKELILSSLVECNYSIINRTDLRVQNGDTVSVRGVGKFIIIDITDETKKGRLRLSAKKYI